jgi:transglutaminase-like putative cysteine protease
MILERLKLEEGWLTLFLIWVMVTLAGIAIDHSDVISGLEVLTLVATGGILAGFVLAKSRFPAGTAHLFSLVYGLALLTYALGGLLPENLTWSERIVDLLSRQADWMGKAMGEGTSRDGMVFVMHTAVVFWLLGYTASWYTFRKPRVWRAVLPSGLVLLSVVYYYYGPRPLTTYLALYMMVALLYVARTYLVSVERVWRSKAVRYEEGIHHRFLRSGFVVASLALAVAWVLPAMPASAAVNDALYGSGVNNSWRKFQDNWTRLFSSLRSYGPAANDPFLDTLNLGGPRNVGNTLVMDIHVAEELPYAYWYASALATYQDGRWSPVPAQMKSHFPDDEPFDLPPNLSRRIVEQTVVNYFSNSTTLYGLPDLVTSDRQMVVNYNTDENGQMLISSLQARHTLRQGDIYRVQSRYSTADAASLRVASTNYPDWVTESYLQVPDTITPETITLAEEITAAYNNPYDKAIALRDYLRQNMAYNDQIDAPPPGVEPIHYFLFEGREGYCTYYASAMVIMLRTQGVPARMAVGYTAGDYDEESGFYRVRAFNAHTWVEAFFPGFGWIHFEPTASLAIYERPEGDADEAAFASPSFRGERDLPQPDFMDELELAALEAREARLDPGLSEEERAAEEAALAASRRATMWQVAGAFLVVSVAGVVMFAANRINGQVESNVEKSYGRLESWARWLGIWFEPVHTPYERADLLSAAVPEGKTAIHNLTLHFVLQRFSRRRDDEAGFEPRKEWQVLRPILIRHSIRESISRALRRLQQKNAGGD